MSESWEIYTLEDPRGGGVRYVGVTKVGSLKRLRGHIHYANKGEKSHRACWIRKLVSEGVTPTVVVIERGAGKEWGMVESRWIAFYRDQGCSLTNSTDGGEGAWGHKVSAEARERIAAARRGKPLSDEHKAKLREAKVGFVPTRNSMDALRRIHENNLGKPRSLEVREKLSASKRRKPGSKPTPEHIAKRVASTKATMSDPNYVHPNKGRRQSDEARAKCSAANKGRVKSPETIEKLKASLKGRSYGKHSPESVARQVVSYHARMDDPNYVDPRRGRKLSPEHIIKATEARKKSIENRRKVSP